MKINHNISALVANTQLDKTNNNLTKSIERLSSGKKINRAADDAAGLAISQKMATQIRGLEQAERNSNDGISVIQTAEGALSEVHSMLQRMRELAVQAANDTYDINDRQAAQDEITMLNSEITRISETTQFNEQNILDGNVDKRTYTDNKTVSVVSLTDSVASGDYGITVTKDAREAVLVGKKMDTSSTAVDASGKITADGAGKININGEEITISEGDNATEVYEKIRELGEKVNVNIFAVSSTTINTATADVNAGYTAENFEFSNTKQLVFASDETGSTQEVTVYCDNSKLSSLLGMTNTTVYGTDVEAEFTTDLSGNRTGFSNTATISCEGNKIVVSDKDNFNLKFESKQGAVGTKYIDSTVAVANGAVTAGSVTDAGTKLETTVTVLDAGPMNLQIGANKGQMMEIRIPKVTPKTLSIDNINVSTSSGAQKAILAVDKAVSQVSEIRSKLGAYQNRLEHAVSNLQVAQENMTESLSRIEDTDMAEEMSNYTQLNVLAQAGTSMLSKANQRPETVLQLLQS